MIFFKFFSIILILYYVVFENLLYECYYYELKDIKKLSFFGMVFGIFFKSLYYITYGGVYFFLVRGLKF